MSKTKIGVIVGSTRLGRSSVSVADWFIKEAERYNNNYQYVIMDLQEYRLPFFGEKDPDNRTELWQQDISKCAAFVIVAPEYNHSIPGVLKNALDYHLINWKHKPVGLVGFGFASSGARAVEHLRQITGALGMIDVQSHLLISMNDDKDATGHIKPRNFHMKPLQTMLDEIDYFVRLQQTNLEVQSLPWNKIVDANERED